MTQGPRPTEVKRTEEEKAMRDVYDPFVKRAMKRGWDLEREVVDGVSLTHEKLKVGGRRRRAQVILTASRELDGKAWIHLSASLVVRLPGGRNVSGPFPSSTKILLPEWEDLKVIRDSILGPESKCLMVVAPSTEHVNIAEVHHLWHCPEGDGIPDFTRGSGSI